MKIDSSDALVGFFDGGEHHRRLGHLVGEWKGPTHTWFAPGQPPHESVTEARVESLLGGRFVRMVYRGLIQGGPHAGELLLGFEENEQRFAATWIDSFHTGTNIIVSHGGLALDGAVSVLGSYKFQHESWGWRTAIRRDAAGLLHLESYNRPPKGGDIRTVLSRLG